MSDCLFNLVLPKKGWMKLFFGKKIFKKNSLKVVSLHQI